MAAGNHRSSDSTELQVGASASASSSATNSTSPVHQRNNRFNPVLIILQILVLQVVYYFALAVFTAFLNWLFSVYPADFSAQLLGHPVPGIQLRTLAVGTLLTAAGPTGLALALLVRRARRCADHAVTLLVAHIIICLSMHGVPRRAMWWILQISATVIMSVVAESFCRIIEARERVAFRSDINAAAAAKSLAHSRHEEELDSDPPSPESRSRVSFSVSKLAGAKRPTDRSEEEVSLLVDEV